MSKSKSASKKPAKGTKDNPRVMSYYDEICDLVNNGWHVAFLIEEQDADRWVIVSSESTEKKALTAYESYIKEDARRAEGTARVRWEEEHYYPLKAKQLVQFRVTAKTTLKEIQDHADSLIATMQKLAEVPQPKEFKWEPQPGDLSKFRVRKITFNVTDKIVSK